MWMKEYKKEHRNEISFPLGGIGSGCIGLGGDGRLVEWEIFNHPDKKVMNGFSHIAVKAEKNGKVLDARVLNTDLKAPYTGEVVTERGFFGFGFGPYRETMAGIPHFEDGVFRAAYPLAELDFIDDRFPGNVRLSAFNPLIPLKEDDSSMPAAFFSVTIQNTQRESIDYTAAFSLGNPFGCMEACHERERDQFGQYLVIRRTDVERGNVNYGELCVGTDAEDVSIQKYWYRSRWFDNLSVFWKNFTTYGPLKERSYESFPDGADVYIPDTGTLTARVTLRPGETKTVRFLVSWYIPNCCMHANEKHEKNETVPSWKNYYAVLYPSACSVAADALKRWDGLYAETHAFTEAFYTQSLPEVMLDAAGSNISILKSPTVWRLEDGSFYGWEGSKSHVGSCEGSCTHVWNYAYALPFLFPRLERSMRELNYRENQDENGGMRFRLALPGDQSANFRPCCDGQFGDVIKVYREWKLYGDREWLEALWPKIKKSIEYAWSEKNFDRWDINRDGVLEGRQHHTLDMELFGPNAWLTGMYLAALKAAGEMAKYLHDEQAAIEYQALFSSGQNYVDSKLFNGEYYVQELDLHDRGVLEQYPNDVKSLCNDTVHSAYWNAEAGEIKYQFAEGCVADQVLGQWHANMLNLGEIFDPKHVESALRAIYKYNYKADLRKHVNPCRLYAMADERTTLICEWPEGARKPVIAAPYAEEGWPGIEYQVAAHMQSVGMYREALDVVGAVRERYDGRRRNPFNEIECGSNYARSMASFSLLLAVSGFRFDLPHQYIGFLPHDLNEERQYFFSVDSGWGTYCQNREHRTLKLFSGVLELRVFESDYPIQSVLHHGMALKLKAVGKTVVFENVTRLLAGDELIFN